MKCAHIAKSPIGVFAFSEDGKLLHYKLFSKSPEKNVAEMKKIPQDFLNELKGYEIVEDEAGYEFLRKNIREFSKTLGFCNNDYEFNKFISEFCAVQSKNKMSVLTTKDKLLIQAANALDDAEKIKNLKEQRLYEWFTLHYPELKRMDIAEMIIKFRRRENFPGFKTSTGIDLTEYDEKILIDYAHSVKTTSETIKSLENYIRHTIREVAPNFSSLIDPLLAARLLALAGSLEKLARMPASTIQLLGAEKALFRHLHKQGRSPKYGILYNSSIIQNAKNEVRGKVARILSAKLMQAARIDFYSGRHEEKLKKELDEEIRKV
jgi:nucleolar protein 56